MVVQQYGKAGVRLLELNEWRISTERRKGIVIRCACRPVASGFFCLIIWLIHLFVRPSIRPSVRPSATQPVCPCVRPSVRPSIRSTVCPQAHPPVRPSLRPFIHECVHFPWLTIPSIHMHLSIDQKPDPLPRRR